MTVAKRTTWSPIWIFFNSTDKIQEENIMHWYPFLGEFIHWWENMYLHEICTCMTYWWETGDFTHRRIVGICLKFLFWFCFYFIWISSVGYNSYRERWELLYMYSGPLRENSWDEMPVLFSKVYRDLRKIGKQLLAAWVEVYILELVFCVNILHPWTFHVIIVELHLICDGRHILLIYVLIMSF